MDHSSHENCLLSSKERSERSNLTSRKLHVSLNRYCSNKNEKLILKERELHNYRKLGLVLEESFEVFFFKITLTCEPWGLLYSEDKITAPSVLSLMILGPFRAKIIQISFSFCLTAVFLKLLFVTFRTASGQLIRISNG